MAVVVGVDAVVVGVAEGVAVDRHAGELHVGGSSGRVVQVHVVVASPDVVAHELQVDRIVVGTGRVRVGDRHVAGGAGRGAGVDVAVAEVDVLNLSLHLHAYDAVAGVAEGDVPEMPVRAVLKAERCSGTAVDDNLGVAVRHHGYGVGGAGTEYPPNNCHSVVFAGADLQRDRSGDAAAGQCEDGVVKCLEVGIVAADGVISRIALCAGVGGDANRVVVVDGVFQAAQLDDVGLENIVAALQNKRSHVDVCGFAQTEPPLPLDVPSGGDTVELKPDGGLGDGVGAAVAEHDARTDGVTGIGLGRHIQNADQVAVDRHRLCAVGASCGYVGTQFAVKVIIHTGDFRAVHADGEPQCKRLCGVAEDGTLEDVVLGRRQCRLECGQRADCAADIADIGGAPPAVVVEVVVGGCRSAGGVQRIAGAGADACHEVVLDFRTVGRAACIHIHSV